MDLQDLEAIHGVGGGWVVFGVGSTSLITHTGTVRSLGTFSTFRRDIPGNAVFRSHGADWCGVAFLPDGWHDNLVELDDEGLHAGLQLFERYHFQPIQARCGRSVRMLGSQAGYGEHPRGVWLAVARPWRLYRTGELPPETWRQLATDGAHFWVLLDTEDPHWTLPPIRTLSMWWNLKPTARLSPEGLGERAMHEVTVVPPARGRGPSAVWYRDDDFPGDGPDASSRYAVLPTRRGRPGELLRFPEGVHVQDLRLLPPGVCLVWTDAPGGQPRLTCGTWRDLRQAIETSDPAWFGAQP